MTPDERELLETLLKKLRQLPEIKFSDERDALEKMRERMHRKALGWMAPFVTRQGSILPDFDSLYEMKANLDDRLLGDSVP